MMDSAMGSREAARAALEMCMSRSRDEENECKLRLRRQGIASAAVDCGGEFISSMTRIVERAVVAAKREGVINESHLEEGAVAGAAHEALVQVMNKALGMNVGACRLAMLGLAAVLAGAAVSFAGLLGFVGLIIPHLVRFFVGHDNRIVLPLSAVSGAAFVVVCDLLARVLFAPYEVPVGILMAFLGGPFFIYLILKNRRGSLE